MLNYLEKENFYKLKKLKKKSNNIKEKMLNLDKVLKINEKFEYQSFYFNYSIKSNGDFIDIQRLYYYFTKKVLIYSYNIKKIKINYLKKSINRYQ